MSRRSQALAVFFALMVAAALYAAFHRPTYIFINKTKDHSYDRALKLSLKLAEKNSGIENALILIDGLPAGDGTIERTAERLFHKYRIGAGRQGRGILYLYSARENQFKIEVSYALEGNFPDAVCARLEQAAQTYMLSDIPQDFLSELIITANLHGQDRNAAEFLASPSWLPPHFFSGGAGSVAKNVRPTLDDVQKAIANLDVPHRSAFEAGDSASETLERYLHSLEAGIGDPKLPLLTPGSRIFRMIVPRNAVQQRRVWDYFRRAMPYVISEDGEWALAVFKPGVANLPVVLRKDHENRWHVDEPKAWTWFHRFENGPNFFAKYDDLPLLGALARSRFPTAGEFIYRRRAPTPAPPPLETPLAALVAAREAEVQAKPESAAAWAALGELYLFEMNWRSRALAAFERASRLEPDALPYRWRLVDLYMNNSEADKMLAQLRFIAKALPKDEEVQRWLKQYEDIYRFKFGEF